jgi:acetyltransferase-like isoleucine patch superfamily enzyme
VFIFIKKISALIKKVKFKLELVMSNKYNKVNVYKKYLGLNAGNNVIITGLPNFGSEPYLIFIGNDVRITHNVNFSNHDGGTGIFRKEYPGLNVFGKIIVKDNVFIGSNSTIMQGVTINENVVIGTGSIVTRDCDPDSVYAGVPAKKIKTLEEYKTQSLKKAVFIDTDDHETKKKLLTEHFKL